MLSPKKVVAFKKAIIAAGSQAVRLPFMPNDPRVVESTGALALKKVLKRMLILGGGIIGLEMGTVYSTLGARALPEGIEVTFAPAEEGANASNASVAAPAPQVYDLVLQAVGRTPNGKKIAADKAGAAVTDRGFINVDIQMRTNVSHVFAIGDIVGQPMLAHKAVHEAHVVAEVIAGELQGNKELAAAAFNARVIPSLAYVDPEVAWAGLTEDLGLVCPRHQGQDGPIPVDGTHAGDMIAEVALAIEFGADAVDIGKTIHPLPTLGESSGMAAEVAHGSCTDVPPARK